jgi:hypothetical protein
VSSASSHRHARWTIAAGIPLLGAAGLLAGCSTTMQTAARLQLNDARIRASQAGVRVPSSQASSTVRVRHLQVIASGSRTAFVVTVRNAGTSAVTDLPVSVGYTASRKVPVYLNSGMNLSYYESHLPAIGAGQQITWVFAAGRRLPARAQPFANVGAHAQPPAGEVSMPAISTVARVTSSTTASELLSVRVRNGSGIPQYQLPVYAVARRDGRVVAAGSASVLALDGGSQQTVRLRLLGDARGADLSVEAPPTIFN